MCWVSSTRRGEIRSARLSVWLQSADPAAVLPSGSPTWSLPLPRPPKSSGSCSAPRLWANDPIRLLRQMRSRAQRMQGPASGKHWRSARQLTPLRVKRSMEKAEMSRNHPPFQKQRENRRLGQLRRWRMTLILFPGVGTLRAGSLKSFTPLSITRPRAHIRLHRHRAWLTSVSKICTGTSKPWDTTTRWA